MPENTYTLLKSRRYEEALKLTDTLPREALDSEPELYTAAFRSARNALNGALNQKLFAPAARFLSRARFYLKKSSDFPELLHKNKIDPELEAIKLLKQELRLYSWRGDYNILQSMEPEVFKETSALSGKFPEEACKIYMVFAIVFSRLTGKFTDRAIFYMEQVELVLTQNPGLKQSGFFRESIKRGRAFLHLRSRNFHEAGMLFKDLYRITGDRKDYIFQLF
ncbi:MAG TPA: hypothetical protein DC049_15920, partial [Spirochaetia bacterium]|nr:hypothetical protein [Spirochaetia bacterium]